MERILQVWNVDGLNVYGKPVVRIQFENTLLPETSIPVTLKQLTSKPITDIGDLLSCISNELLNSNGLSSVRTETHNNQDFILYFELTEEQAVSMFTKSSYLADRLIHNPDTTLDYLITELSAPIHSTEKPIVFGVTGSNGKTSVVNLIYQLLRNCVNADLSVGKSDSVNVEMNGQRVGGIIDEQYDSHRHLLSLDLDAGVVELTRKGLWSRGMPTTQLSVGVLTTISYEHIGSCGIRNLEDILAIKAVVARNAKDLVVLNYDDALLLKLAQDIDPKKVVYFSLEEEQTSHFGEKVVFLGNNGTIFFRNGSETVSVANVKDMPYTDGGNIIHNIKNVLAALGAVYFHPNIKLDLQKTKRYLNTLDTDHLVDGRFNKVYSNGRLIVIDYAHNPDAIRNLNTSLKKMGITNPSCLTSIHETRDRHFCELIAKELSAFYDPIYLRNPDSNCQSPNGIKVNDLFDAIKIISPSTQMFFLEKNPFERYVDTIKTGECGVILGTGLDYIPKVKTQVLAYVGGVSK
ncbi:MAG: hypothetical protein KJ597_06315 [Nanoarchaeota archaeon]|nr:hypothetical protein [Nanoarchaeota archaeon]MBU1623161.1 hypothetical protein [Nanoarchaeota archaeon]